MVSQPATFRIYEFGGFRLDKHQRLLFRREGEPVPLTPKAFAVLLALVENSGRTLSKDELLDRVWGETFVEEANLTQTISVLRRKLGENKNEHRYILTEPG